MNPNDVTAKYYDIVQRPLKSPEVTLEEIRLITKLVPAGSRILDVGCGTGRHILKLKNIGYDVFGIDSSAVMLSVLQTENPTIEVANADFLTFNFGDRKFDLVIMMWNAFNEIGLTEESAKLIFEKLAEILGPDGKVLINIDDPSTFDPATLHFETDYLVDNLNYHQDWSVVAFDKETNTTNSKEKITVSDTSTSSVQGDSENIVDEVETTIVQRWWSQKQIENIAKEFGFSFENRQLEINRELYLVGQMTNVERL